MAIRYRHRPDPDLYPSTADTLTEGEVQTVAELEALVLLGSIGPADEISIDGKGFKKATNVPELREPLEDRYGKQTGPLGTALMYAAAAVVVLIAAGLALALASKLLKVALVVGLITGAIWLLRKAAGRPPRKPAANDLARKK